MAKSMLLDYSQHDITAMHDTDDMTGQITFVCGQLVRIIEAECLGYHLSPIGKAKCYDHRITMVQTNPK